MKRFANIAAAVLLPLMASAARPITMPDQTLSYKADYHYGFIKITAGTISIDLSLDGDNFTGTLNGQSVPIGGHVYAISDTLCSSMTPTQSLSRETVTYANGWYAKPDIGCNASVDFANPALFKNTMGAGTLDASDETMEAISISTDMLAMFYYFRQIDFADMTPGQNVCLTIALPGGGSQSLNITYDGIGSYEGSDTYKATFNFSYGGETTDYPITAHVDPLTRLPLMLAADLKIGHIELRLTDDTF